MASRYAIEAWALRLPLDDWQDMIGKGNTDIEQVPVSAKAECMYGWPELV